jgi:hypothetical protein
MAVGAERFQIENADLQADPAIPMMNYVATHKSPEDIFMIPSKLANFRLMTGAPILADFDSIPYRDKDIMKWYQRLQWASYFYMSGQGDNPCKALKNTFTKYGVTYAVVERSDKLTVCQSFPVVYQDAIYRIYALSPKK